MPRRKAPHIPDELLDQLLAGADAKTAFDADGLLDALKKVLAERALNAEMDHHLATDESGDSRNGYGRKVYEAAYRPRSTGAGECRVWLWRCRCRQNR
jgi:putative transposase